MEFLSFLAIPVNVAILLFCGHSGVMEDGSVWVYMFSWNRDNDNVLVPKLWSKFSIIVLAVGVEHFMFILKALLALLIENVPEPVLEAEKKRP
jgi:hypothetical protein